MVKSNDRDNDASCTEKYEHHIPCSFAYKVACIDDKFSKPVVLYREKNAVNKFIEAILREYDYCKIIIKKNHFNKIMSVEDEERFQSSNKWWMCNKPFAAEDSKISDHDHVTGRNRGSAHWSCYIDLKLTKNVPVIFHNLKGYASHLIMQEIGKFDVKVNVIPKWIRKIHGFYNWKKLIFIDGMQFMNSSLDAENWPIMILDIYHKNLVANMCTTNMWIYLQF